MCLWQFASPTTYIFCWYCLLIQLAFLRRRSDFGVVQSRIAFQEGHRSLTGAHGGEDDPAMRTCFSEFPRFAMSADDVSYHTALNCCLAWRVFIVCIKYLETHDGSVRKQHLIATDLELETAA